jgi:rubrerythrin
MCGRINPEFGSLLMPNRQFVDELYPEVQIDESHFIRYVICQDCEKFFTGGSEEKKQELLETNWQCQVCGFLNRNEEVFCRNCQAPRKI